MTDTHAPNDPQVRLVAKDTVFKGYFQMDKYTLDYRSYDGATNTGVEREVLERGHAVAVLLFDPDRQKLVFIEQFRAGAYAAGWQPWLLEIVAGIIDPGEQPEQVAKRETREESGLDVTDLHHIIDYLPTPGACSESIALYIGRVDSSKAPEYAGLETENEDIHIRVMDKAEALDLLDVNGFNNSAILTAMQWFALNQSKIAKLWPVAKTA